MTDASQAQAFQVERHFGNRVVRCYTNRPGSVDDMFRRSVARNPHSEALVDGPIRLSYATLDETVERVAVNLLDAGLKPGDRVVTVLGNRHEYVIVLLACARAGLIVVPLSSRLTAREILSVCEIARTSAVIHLASMAEAVPSSGSIAELRWRYSVGGESDGSVDFSRLTESGRVIQMPKIPEDSVFCISFTSGTTGTPKGAMITNLGVVHSCLHYQSAMKISAPEVAVLAIPAAHVGGIAVVLPVLHYGGRLIMMPEFKSRAFLALAAAERMTYGALVPAMFNLLLLDEGFSDYDLSTWRIALYGAAPMPEATVRAFSAAVPGIQMINTYGATETTAPITIMPPGAVHGRPDSVGKVVQCGDIQVVNEQGEIVTTGEPGEIWVSGPMVVPGYWDNPTATKECFEGGYWKSGDIGCVDEEGFVYVLDRKKDVINRGGLKVFSVEIESILKDFPAVIEAAVVGRPDDVLGERVHAFVVTGAESVDPDELRRFCGEQLADYKVPELITVLDTPLPRNQTGKVQKKALLTMESGTTTNYLSHSVTPPARSTP